LGHKKTATAEAMAVSYSSDLTEDDSLGERATISRLNVELDLLAFDQRATSVTLNLRVVNKDVRLAIDSDETPALLVVEPLNGSYSHYGPP
jgi:hypothetical protein